MKVINLTNDQPGLRSPGPGLGYKKSGAYWGGGDTPVRSLDMHPPRPPQEPEAGSNLF